MEIGRVRPINIEDEMRGAYLDYAMSVITARALPDVRDGLKPVQRRILYAMDELSLRSTNPYKKSARIVGEVLGKYHPHGDAPVYETMVRMAQDFSMRYVLIDGQGNFGSVDGDPPAAMRYTEARLAAIAEEMLADIDKNTVDFTPNFDGSLKEPTVLPAKLPNLLLNGSSGIAVGMATNVPPHNLNEVSDALIHMITHFGQSVDQGIPFNLLWSRIFGAAVDAGTLSEALKQLKPEMRALVKTEAAKASKKPTDEVQAQALLNVVDEMIDIPPDKLMEFIKGPDFPTAGIILGEEGIKSAYTTGHGRITIRAKAHVEEMRGGRYQIIVTQLPFQVNKAALQEKIAELVRDKRIEGISELRDESDRQGMRVVIELKRETQPKQVLNQLYKYTSMQGTFSINMLALVDGQPRVLTLKMVLLHYLNYRKEIITRRALFDLEKARHRAHILEGLKIALDHLDEVIATIRKSRDAEVAKAALMKNFKLTEIQAQAILDMQLRRLAALERQKILDELAETLRLIKHLEDLLANPGKILYLIRDELTELKTKYGDARRTKIMADESADFTEEDLVPDEPILVAISGKNYVKRMPGDSYRLQRRGKGIAGTIAREDDPVQILAPASTLDQVVFFSNRGRAFQVKSYDLPDAGRQARGVPISNFVTLQPEERIIGAVAVRNFDQAGYAIFITASGDIKRVAMTEYSSARSSGIIGLNVADGDEVVWVGQSDGKGQVMAITRQGQVIRFPEEDVRASGRTSGGVRAIKLGDGDAVVDADIITAEQYLAVVTKTGLGKRTPLEEFPVQGRGGGGVRAANIGEKTGLIAGAKAIGDADEVAIGCAQGTVFRTPAEGVPLKARALQVAQIVALEKGDSVTSLLRIRGRGDGRPAPTDPAPTDNDGPPAPEGDGASPSEGSATRKAKLPNKANARATSEKMTKSNAKAAKETPGAARGKAASTPDKSSAKRSPSPPVKNDKIAERSQSPADRPEAAAPAPRAASRPVLPSKANSPSARKSSGASPKNVAEAKSKTPAGPKPAGSKDALTARPSVSNVVTVTSRTKSVKPEKAAEQSDSRRIILAPSRAERLAAERPSNVSPAEASRHDVAKPPVPNKAKSPSADTRSSGKSKPQTLIGSIATKLGRAGGEKKAEPNNQGKAQAKGREKQGRLPL